MWVQRCHHNAPWPMTASRMHKTKADTNKCVCVEGGGTGRVRGGTELPITTRSILASVLDSCYTIMNEWKCIHSASQRLHKTLRVHSARYTQCIHVSPRKLKTTKGTLIPIKYKQPLPTHPFLKVQLYIVVKCRNIYRVTNNDYRKKISHNAPVTRQYF